MICIESVTETKKIGEGGCAKKRLSMKLKSGESLSERRLKRLGGMPRLTETKTTMTTTQTMI